MEWHSGCKHDPHQSPTHVQAVVQVKHVKPYSCKFSEVECYSYAEYAGQNGRIQVSPYIGRTGPDTIASHLYSTISLWNNAFNKRRKRTLSESHFQPIRRLLIFFWLSDRCDPVCYCPAAKSGWHGDSLRLETIENRFKHIHLLRILRDH